MTSPLGQYGASGYESPEARTLGKFATDRFSYRDQAKNIIELNNAVGYMSAYMRKMQRGIDDANRNFVQDIQALINDLIVLLGGGGDTGFDWGDLKYVIQAIGALFGFTNAQGEITVPVNLFNAAWYFFSSYILPVQNFTDAINLIIDGAIASILDVFGEVPIVGQALQQLAVIISDIRDALIPVSDAVNAFFDALAVDINDLPGITSYFGILKPVWDVLAEALDGINLPDFSLVFHQIALWTLPFVEALANVVNALTYFVNLLTGAQKAEDLQDVLDDLVSILKLNSGGFGSGAVNTVTWASAFITDILNPTGLLSAVDQALRDLLTGINNATDTDITNWLTNLLTSASNLDASKLVGNIAANLITGVLNIANIPSLPQSKITNLVSDLAAKLTSTSPLDGANLTGTVAASLITGALALANIPTLPQSQITNLVTDLAAKLTSSSALNADNLTSGSLPAARIAASTITDTMLAGSIAQSKITNLVTDLAARLTSSSALNATNLTSGTLPAARIANSTITDAMLAGSIAQSKIVNLTTDLAARLTSSSALNATNLTSGTLPAARIANSTITDAMLAGSIAQSKITNLTTDLAARLTSASALNADNLGSGSVPAARIANNTITDAMLAGSIAQAKITNLTTDLAARLTSASPLPAANITGVINELNLPDLTPVINAIEPEWLGQVPITSLTNINPNLLWNGGFDDPVSLGPTSKFTHDATVGRTTNPIGSAKVTFNGTTKIDYANMIDVSEGDTIEVDGYAYWSGVTTTGPMMQIMVNGFDAAGTDLGGVVVGTVGAAGTASGWTRIYTTSPIVIPAGVPRVALSIQALGVATAGSGWFDDCSLTKTRLFQENWFDQTVRNKIQNLTQTGTIAGDFVLGVTQDLRTEVRTLFRDAMKELLNSGDPTGVPTDPTNSQVAQGFGNVWRLLSEQAARISTTQAKLEALAGAGSSLAVDYSDFPDNQPLPSGDYDVQVTGTGQGSLGTRSGAAGWYGTLSGDRDAKVRVKTTRPSGDFVILRTTLKDLPQSASPDAKIHGICRLDSSWQNYVFARGYCTGFLTYKGDLGFVLNGVERVWKTISLNWNTTMTIYFGYQGNKRRYLVYSGNSKVLDFDENNSSDNPHYGTFSLDPATLGTPSNQRYFGLIGQLRGGKHSGSMSAFSMSEGT